MFNSNLSIAPLTIISIAFFSSVVIVLRADLFSARQRGRLIRVSNELVKFYFKKIEVFRHNAFFNGITRIPHAPLSRHRIIYNAVKKNNGLRIHGALRGVPAMGVGAYLQSK